MARKVTCPHCGAQTYDTPSCGRCGGSLRGPKAEAPEKQEDPVEAELVYKIGMLQRAQQIGETLSKVVLARYETIQRTAGVDLASTKLVVKRERAQFIYFNAESSPVQLRPGRYELGRIMVAGRGRPDDRGCLVCEVSQDPITVTFVFPDFESFDQNLISHDRPLILRGIQEALNSLSMRTSDDQLGGALLQLRLACNEPIKLVRCRDYTRWADHDSPLVQVNKRLVKEPAKSLWQRAWDWLVSNPPEEPGVRETFRTGEITLKDLYPMIRHELAEAVCNSIRNFTVEALYDRQDTNRARLHESIKGYMEKTLEGYGLRIIDVVAFQFRSPDYEEFLKRRGDVSLNRRTLAEIERNETDLRRQRRELDQEEFEHVESLEEKKDLLALDREGRVQERTDRLAQDKQTRQLTMEAQRLEFERQQQDAEDERQHRQTLRALEYQEKLHEMQAKLLEQTRDAEHNRRLEAIQLIAGYPPEQQFLLALQYNPELQQAFVALQQAQSNDQKVEMAQQFQTQIQSIYGHHSEQTNQLLLAAAQALGLAVSSRLKDQPPVEVKILPGQLPPPEQPDR
jgi:hypothetical protein